MAREADFLAREARSFSGLFLHFGPWHFSDSSIEFQIS